MLMLKRVGGFTILETMIVMAVSATMLLSAMLLFSGQQRRSQFNQSVRDLESKFQDILNDVQTGYFPNVGGTTCTKDLINGPIVSLGSTEQGANLDCVFLGKAIHLQSDKIISYTIVGNNGAGATLASAKPVITDDLKEEVAISWGSRIYNIYWDNPPENASTTHLPDGALIAVASTPNGTGASALGVANPGIQRINTYSSGPSSPVGTTSTLTQLKTALQSFDASSWPSNGRVIICVEDAPSGIGRLTAGIVISGGQEGTGARIQQSGDGFQCV